LPIYRVNLQTDRMVKAENPYEAVHAVLHDIDIDLEKAQLTDEGIFIEQDTLNLNCYELPTAETRVNEN